MHNPTDWIIHTTAFVTPVVENGLEREIAQWVHPMKDRSDDPSHHERTLLPRSYISLRFIMISRPTFHGSNNPLGIVTHQVTQIMQAAILIFKMAANKSSFSSYPLHIG